MKSLSKADAKEWCSSHRILLDDQFRPQPVFSAEQGYDFKIPGNTGRRVAFSKYLLEIVPADQDILIWISNWGVWPSGDQPHIFDRFRMSYGENRPLIEIPAFLFEPSEREDLLSFFTISILFLYDCHLLSASGDTWIFLSHDEIGWACSREPDRLQVLSAFD